MQMNKKQKQIIKQYLKQVKSNIPFRNKCSQHLLKNLTLSISEIFTENPTFTLNDLMEHFGNPKDIASILLEEVPTEKIVHMIKQRRVNSYVFLLVVATISAIFCNAYWFLGKNASPNISKTIYMSTSASTIHHNISENIQ